MGKAAKLKYRPICLPLGLAKLAAPYYERRSLKERKPLFSPYSVAVLASNGQFSHAAASECFAYHPRPVEDTLQGHDSLAFWGRGERTKCDLTATKSTLSRLRMQLICSAISAAINRLSSALCGYLEAMFE